MKKLLAIMVLGLLFGGNANALTLNKCFYTEHFDAEALAAEGRPILTDKFNKDIYEDIYYEFDFKNNIARQVFILNDNGIQKRTKEKIKYNKEEFERGGSDRRSDTSLVKRILKNEYKITFVDKNYIIAVRNSYSTYVDTKTEITVNLNKHTVEKRYRITVIDSMPDELSVQQCESSSSTQSNIARSGSGFFINNKGYFITNNHVIKGCKQSKITFKEESVDADVIATDQTLDLALLKAKVKPRNYLNLSDDPPEKLQKIYVAGYPFGKGLSDDLKLTQGIISSVKGYGDNLNQIQIDAAINSGNSGGPIVDEDGDLVGVAVSGLNKSKSEGIAFGIKSAAVKNFLDVNKIKYSTSSLMNFGMSNKKLNNLLEDSAVYTFCN